MNGWKATTKRLSAMLLAALLMVSSVDYGVLNVAAAEQTETVCPNHTEHTDDCGYAEAAEGAACAHEHTDECYGTVTECVHEHGEECYEKTLTCENTEEGHEHTDGCYTETSICTHTCSEESGCIRRELDCKHEHDENCGYVEAVEGQPCTHSCELCSGAGEDDTEEETEDEDEDIEENLTAMQADTGTPAANTAITSWEDLKNALKNGGDYTLAGDVTSTNNSSEDVLEVPTGVTVTLDLAGHKIDRNLDSPLSGGQVMKILGTLTVTDSEGGGVITGGYGEGMFLYAAAVYVGGTFTLNGGSISGNKTSGDCDGTGVAVDNNATFIMNGGSICDNHGEGSESYGGGVYAYPDATVKLLGGSIEKNSVKSSYGGGLYFQGSNVTVGGSIVIQDNTAKGGTTSNVKGGYGCSLLLSEEVPLNDEAKIGWTVEPYRDGDVANGIPVAKGKDAAKYVDNFSSDGDSSYIIGMKENDAETTI